MTNKTPNVSQNLKQFYDKPVAKVSLELFFSVVMVAFFAAFAIRPTLVTMSNLIKEIQDKETLNTNLKQKIAALSSAQGIYLASQERLSLLDEAIPSTPQFGRTLALIEKLCSDRNLTVTSLTSKDVPKESSPSANFKALKRISRPVTLTVSGDYPTIRQLVQDLQNTRRTLIVDNIVFSVSSSKTEKKLLASITISIVYFGAGQ